jgi:hypothetical protein
LALEGGVDLDRQGGGALDALYAMPDVVVDAAVGDDPVAHV